MTQFLDVCQRAARAGAEQLLHWQGKFQFREKGPKDLVSEADLASQQAIREVLLGAFPDHQFLGEEDSPDSQPAADAKSPFRWIVDPLDGTTNYVHNMPAYAVSIGLERHGQLEVGVVYDPILNEMYCAEVGRGATLNGRPIRVSDCQHLSQALMACSFSTSLPRDSPEIQQFIEVLLESQAIRRLGSCALNLCYLAAGRLDGYWATSVKVWDVAAGVLILREAGGVITHLFGDPLDLFQPHFSAAATPQLHRHLVRTLLSA